MMILEMNESVTCFKEQFVQTKTIQYYRAKFFEVKMSEN